MNRHEFSAWLRRQAGRDDSVGDLAHDVRLDHDWPRGRVTLEALHEYLARVEGTTIRVAVSR